MKRLTAFITLISGILLFGIGAVYIGDPTVGNDWVRAAVALALGMVLFFVGIWLGLKQKDIQ